MNDFKMHTMNEAKTNGGDKCVACRVGYGEVMLYGLKNRTK